jgi:DnaJ-class molecular chaperone
MYNKYYNILGLSSNASKEDIKKAYKDIALSCHPDKLINIRDENEKNKKIDKFKEASIAYDILMKKNELHTNDEFNFHDFDDFNDVEWDNNTDWKDIWYNFFHEGGETKEFIKDTLLNIASSFIKKNIQPKYYYNPSTKINDEIMKHEITFEVTYQEILLNTKRKLRLVLVDIDDPLYVDIYCGQFPTVIKEYTDDNDNEHEIIINMEIKADEKFDHIISKNGNIDIITNIEINLIEYISGYTKKIPYIDNNNIEIEVPPFQKEFYEIVNKGLKKGSFIVNINIKNIESELWNALSEKDKVEMIRILKTLYKTI